MEIGRSERLVRVEPIEDPVPRTQAGSADDEADKVEQALRMLVAAEAEEAES